ncbi:MAG: sporulation protein [Pseudonocardia sp.]|nr:sporulation protein [Pseudonocardia sp.]
MAGFGWGFGKPAAEVEIRVDRDVVRPGDTVRATVRLTLRRDLVEPEISVALLHVDRYGSGGDARTDEWAVDGHYAFDGVALRAGVPVERTVDLVVPSSTTNPGRDGSEDDADDADDAPVSDDPDDYTWLIDESERWGPPTSRGKQVSSSWEVQVLVPGRGRAKVDARAEVTVLAVAGPMPDEPETPRGSTRCAISFEDLPATSVPAGAAISGRVRVTALEEITARAIRVDLVRVESERLGGDTLEFETVDSAEVSGALTLGRRDSRDLPFTLAVPPDAPPSVDSENAVLTWRLRGVVDVPRREDDVADRRIVVHSPE